MRKVYSVTDLGPGDGGKGGFVHALACRFRPKYVVKEGGAQGSHGVRSSNGESFNFAQWGCGTFEGIPTYLSERIVITPHGLINEANALQHLGIYNPWAMLYCHPNCLCASPYHQVWSQNYELSLGEHQHGTIGTGVGKAYRDYEEDPDLAIFARELTDKAVIRQKLSMSREKIFALFADFDCDSLPAEDSAIFRKNMALLLDNEAFDNIVDEFYDVGIRLQFLLLEDILKFDGILISERSHGVLTDAESALKPHVSALRTLPEFSEKMYRDAGFDGKIVNLGVHRAYEIRHGAGPLPSRDDKLREKMLPGSHKDTNRWQGEVQVGAFDIRLLNYAIKSCGGAKTFDGLALSWFDQILLQERWEFCTDYRYRGTMLPRDAEISTALLNSVEAILTSYELEPGLSSKSNDYIFDYCADILSKHVEIPLRLLSIGATERDKIFK